jgi:hypothetical protein
MAINHLLMVINGYTTYSWLLMVNGFISPIYGELMVNDGLW